MSYVETSALKNSTIMFLYSERDQINLSPVYQRMGDVWTREKKRLLIDCKRQADAVQALKFHGMSLSIWEIGQP